MRPGENVRWSHSGLGREVSGLQDERRSAATSAVSSQLQWPRRLGARALVFRRARWSVRLARSGGWPRGIAPTRVGWYCDSLGKHASSRRQRLPVSETGRYALFFHARALVATAFLRTGQQDSARQVVLRGDVPPGTAESASPSWVLVQLGDSDEARRQLRKLEDTVFTLAWLPSFPMYDGIRTTPLYRRLIRRVGVVPR